MHYDLIVIGNTAAGRAGALTAARAGKAVALVEPPATLSGGVTGQAGPFSSEGLRQILAELAAYRYRSLCQSPMHGKEAAMAHLRQVVAEAATHELRAARDELARHGVALYRGEVRFIGPHELDVDDLLEPTRLSAESLLIAASSRLRRPSSLRLDTERMIVAEEIPALVRLPRSLVLMGADSIGVAYGLMLAMLGVQVTLIDTRCRTRSFRDEGLAGMVLTMAASPQFTLAGGVEIAWSGRLDDGRVAVRLASGERIVAEVAAYNDGRVGQTDGLNLSAAGLQTDEHGRLWCNDNLQTWQPHIYGCGDVVGYPHLDESPHEQAERAVAQILQQSPSQRLRIDSESRVSRKSVGNGASKTTGLFVRG